MSWFILHWMIIVLFVFSWKIIIKIYAKRLKFNESLMIYWQSQQLKIFMWLAIFEVLIVENHLLKFIQLL